VIQPLCPSIKQQMEPSNTKKEKEREHKETQEDEEAQIKFSSPNCRYYEQKYPEVEDLVMVEVKSIEEMGAYVALKEYNDIEGMILLSELSRRRIRSINKIIRVGRLEVVVVLRVDKEKGYIDLSKRRVSEEDIAKCEEKYNKAKTVHSIMRHVAETMKQDLEELYGKIGWPLYKRYGHAYDGFKLVISDPEPVLKELNLDEETKKALLKNIQRRLTPQPVKVRADIEVTCFGYEGIDAVKAALTKGQLTSTEECPIKIKLVAPPLYVAVTTAIQKDLAIKALNTAIEAISVEIKKFKGDLEVKIAPRTVHERDERELSSLLNRLERENQDKPEEEEGEEEEEEGEEED